ncbi:MAG: ATP-dependent metallopeptidase FtsH/Yme1/Tma family protein [Coriobacteriaceae bacterium]|uniref:ATP-dependent zinc metalloprotease FtsH n=1 Tax=Atopobium sp. oral taxon 416 TaxID=712157 RepID=UPI000FF3B643|nr:ATP-dependent zinc metalloprotease FtsH [Atopobium sp. oral taxon 416]QUC02065.1 ATP-dependent zinc metalloprotease FtsH [Atopobium sp. oral taxon 416]RRF98688.1 MAG: ATP-dependent metallopeptidase FtsH/Yme1/Tma family protein [Coriobacteriaceae bacterium]
MEDNDKRPRQSVILYLIIAIALLFALNSYIHPAGYQETQSVSYSQFLNMVDDNQVSKAQIDTSNNEITFVGKNNITYQATAFPDDSTLVQRLQDHNVDMSASIPNENSNLMTYMLLSYIIPLALIFFFGWLLNRRLRKSMGDTMDLSGSGGFGGGNLSRSSAREVKGQEVHTTFKDVAGQDEAKESLQEIVDFLRHPQKYAAIGARCPRGALLVGPPGTGKTLLARAVAGEAGVTFFQISGSEFVEMFVGRGAARVRDLFKEAKKKAPCIVFIDEIDAIGKRRDSSINSNDEREQTLNQLLSEMDGFDNQKGIVVLAATNRPEILDPALLRPGRFDRRIHVELPDLAGRKAILKLHANDVKMEPGIDLGVIARSTPGASGADLANIINEAALRAVRIGRSRVSQDDIQESVDVVIAGEKRKSTVLSEHEKQVVSYHEVGHAIVGAVQRKDAPVEKITIVPRTSGALGFTMQVDQGEHYLMTRKEMEEQIAVLCGGRAAEELIFHDMTNGASNDIEKATQIARAMVTQYGMTNDLGMVQLGRQTNRYLGGGEELVCSEGTQEKVDELVQKIVEQGHQSALKTLQENRFKLHEIARYLQKKETITGKEFMAMFTRDDGFAPKSVAAANPQS